MMYREVVLGMAYVDSEYPSLSSYEDLLLTLSRF
jgi:hypothetical protein